MYKIQSTLRIYSDVVLFLRGRVKNKEYNQNIRIRYIIFFYGIDNGKSQQIYCYNRFLLNFKCISIILYVLLV